MTYDDEIIAYLGRYPHIRVIIYRGWRIINTAAPIDGLVCMIYK